MNKKLIQKPIKRTIINDVINFFDIIKFIENKYKIDIHDYAHSRKHFNKYQEITNDTMPFGNNVYPDGSGLFRGFKSNYTIVRDGKRIPATKKQYDADFKLINEHYERFKNWCKTNPEPPYLNYWHWLLDNCFSEIRNGCSSYLNIKEILEGDSPEWVKKITQFIYNEFKDYLDDGGGLEVWIEW